MKHLTSKDATILINVALRTSQCVAVIQKNNEMIPMEILRPMTLRKYFFSKHNLTYKIYGSRFFSGLLLCDSSWTCAST